MKKTGLGKIKFMSEGKVTYQEGAVANPSTPL